MILYFLMTFTFGMIKKNIHFCTGTNVSQYIIDFKLCSAVKLITSEFCINGYYCNPDYN